MWSGCGRSCAPNPSPGRTETGKRVKTVCRVARTHSMQGKKAVGFVRAVAAEAGCQVISQLVAEDEATNAATAKK